MNGIAISLYDKFADLGVLIDIIREHWDDEYYISVCSNHPNAKARLSEFDIDTVATGKQINYSPDMESPKKQILITSRILDSFKKACKGVLKTDCEYVMHLHADAWPLSERGYTSLVDEMKSREKKFAVRGPGLEFRTQTQWCGHVMDQFLLFEREFAAANDIFDYRETDLLPHTTIHNALMLFLLGRVELSNVYWYSNMESDVYWDGTDTNHVFSGIRPGIVIPDFDFLHIAREAFPAEHGAELQAAFLRDHGIADGPHVSSLLNRHDRSLDEVCRDLAQIEKRQDRRLRLLGYKPKTFGRRFDDKEAILDRPRSILLKAFADNLLSKPARVVAGLLRWLPGEKDYLYLRHKEREKLTRSAEWPDELLADRYDRAIRDDDFPGDTSEMWFKNLHD